MWYIYNIKSEIHHIKGVHLDGYQTMVRADRPAVPVGVGQILRSAARGFFAGMGVTAAGTLLLLALGGGTTEALYLSSGLGWGVGAAVYALSSFLCGCREWWNARA